MAHVAPANSEGFVTHIYAWRNTESQANEERLITGGGEDSEKTSRLTALGIEKAEKLAKKVVETCKLDVIYSSDLTRAYKVAEAVQRKFLEVGTTVKIIPSKQLREIMHGEYELMDSRERNRLSAERIDAILDQELASPGDKDPLLLWKIHPITQRRALNNPVPIDVASYIESGKTDPETTYELYIRAIAEFSKIASENPNKTVGICTHGIILTALIDAQDENAEGLFRALYHGSKIARNDRTVVSPPTKVDNCDMLHFTYDPRTNKLHFVKRVGAFDFFGRCFNCYAEGSTRHR